MSNIAVPTKPSLVKAETIAVLMEREKKVIAEGERMRAIAQKTGSWGDWTWRDIISKAKKRLEVLEAGLVPIRITGKSYPLKDILDQTQAVPSEIVEQATEAKNRFPDATVAVFGWEKDLVTEERRRRDPVLALSRGDQWYFLGFWLEIALPDAVILPEFFGMVWPWAEKRGRGRPRKGSVINHPLLGN